MSRIIARLLPVLAAIALFTAPVTADALRDELAELAKSVKDVLEEERQTSVAVGDFSGPPRLDSQFGPGIQTGLMEELAKAGVSVNKRADLTLTGNYSDAEERSGDDVLLVIKINARILSRNGDELVKLSQKLTPRLIKDNTTIAKITGVTVKLPPAADKATRNEKIKEAVRDPKVNIEGNKVSARAGSDFAVEILAHPSLGAPLASRKPMLVDGQAVVDIARNELYQLKIHNGQSCEAAVTVTIDGVDVFHFSMDRDTATGKPKFTHYILSPNAATPITGWHVTNDPNATENIWSFLVTEYGKGAVSQINAPRGKVGVITVTFALAAQSKDQLPEDDGARSASGNETGFGPGQRADIKEVKRVIGTVREVVSIRYSH